VNGLLGFLKDSRSRRNYRVAAHAFTDRSCARSHATIRSSENLHNFPILIAGTNPAAAISRT
jgi:hypothetical protein